SIPSHPKLKNTNLLDLSVEKIYIKLKNETFLNEKNAWINLYEWFKSYVTHYVVRELIRDKGIEYIKNIDKVALNKLFQDYLVKEQTSNRDLELFLGIKTNKALTQYRNIALPLTMTDNYLSIMSNLVYHTIRENLSNQHFQLSDDSPWPTVSVEKRLLKGSIQ